MKKEGVFVLSIFVSLFLISLVSADNVYENSNFTSSVQGYGSVNSQFVVKVLKYEPYPVSPGESFDLWVKVENVGVNDAKNVRFKLNLNYPFSSNETETLDQNYGLIYGQANAYSSRAPGEVSNQANQVILKYHIIVDNNANPGVQNIGLQVFVNSAEQNTVFNLPITIDKTKTDINFDFQKVSTDGYSFIVSNVGQNDADSLSVSIKPEEGISFSGERVFIIGNLNAGDYTKFIAPIKLSENNKEVTFDVQYTDSAGARRSIEKVVSLEGINFANNENNIINNSYIKWIYAFVGFIFGIIAMMIVKRKEIKNLGKK